MNRGILAIMAMVALGLLAFLMLYQPAARQPRTEAPPPAIDVQTGAPIPEVPPPPRPEPVEPPAPPDEPILRVEPVDAAVEEEKGPFEVDLGQHVVHLKDPEHGRVARFRLRLLVPTRVTASEVRRRRQELLRMLYFLATHRRAEGAMGPDGQARFEHDLLERYRNVVHTGEVIRLELAEYQVGSKEELPRARPFAQ